MSLKQDLSRLRKYSSAILFAQQRPEACRNGDHRWAAWDRKTNQWLHPHSCPKQTDMEIRCRNCELTPREISDPKPKSEPCVRCNGTGTVHGITEDDGGCPALASWPCERGCRG